MWNQGLRSRGLWGQLCCFSKHYDNGGCVFLFLFSFQDLGLRFVPQMRVYGWFVFFYFPFKTWD